MEKMNHQALYDFNRDVVSRALAMLPARLDSREARCLLLAIALQESGCVERCQKLDGGERGPARGLWQFERSGGVKGVLHHPACARLAVRLCIERCNTDAPGPVWEALEHDDILAAVLARLLLLADPCQLPELHDEDGAWHYYLRCWRPGKPHRHRWTDAWRQARAVLGPC